MSRIKIGLPARFLFQTELSIHIAYVNYGGHLGNDAVLALAHEARIQMLKNFDYTESDIEGCGLIMTDAAVVYKSEAFAGEILIIKIAIDDITNIGFDILYLLLEKNSGREVARIKTAMAFFNYKNRKVCSVPEPFYNKFRKGNNFD